MKADVALPSEAYDTVYIVICFLVFFWLFKAVKRFYRTFVLRRAVIQDSLIQIHGLGSYLAYFDGATNSHLHAIVHTRQTKPPVDMPMIFVPCSLLKTTIFAENSERSMLEIQFNATVPGRLILMLNFHLTKFRSAVAVNVQRKRSNFFDSSNHISIRDSLFSLDQQSITSLSDTRRHTLSYLSEYECCDRMCVQHDCVVGSQTIQFNFVNPQLPSNGANA
jgi:hypothetical protein